MKIKDGNEIGMQLCCCTKVLVPLALQWNGSAMPVWPHVVCISLLLIIRVQRGQKGGVWNAFIYWKAALYVKYMH